MAKKLLICTPTCNRPDIIEEVLRFESDYYIDYDFDIAYYDSGSNDDTKNIIDRYRKSFGDRISYNRTPYDQCLDYKLVDILKSADRKKYDYIWLIGDSISITKEALDIILPILEEDYDLVRTPLAGAGSTEDVICTDTQEWFERCSGSMAHMVSTIMSTRLLFDNEDEWNRLSDKYIVCNELCDRHGYFYMVAFYLERILVIDNFRGIMIGNRVKWRRDSPLKGMRSYWMDELFDVWIRSYAETILALPDIYHNKEEVIRKSDNIMIGRFSPSMLARYRINGQYNSRVFRRYKKYFPLVTNSSVFMCGIIAGLPVFILKWVYGSNRYSEAEWEDSLADMKGSIKDRRIIIYGAGLYGERVLKYTSKNWRNEIIGVAVTNKSDNMDHVNGVKVYPIDELTDYRREAYVIIATLPDAARSITKVLKKKKFRNYISLFR